VDPDEIAGYMLIMVIGVTVPGFRSGGKVTFERPVAA